MVKWGGERVQNLDKSQANGFCLQRFAPATKTYDLTLFLRDIP